MMFITPTPPMPSVIAPMKKRSASMPMVMPSIIGLNSSRPNMVMARLSFGEKCWRLAMAVRNCCIACASNTGATGSNTITLEYFVAHFAVFGKHAAHGRVRQTFAIRDSLEADRFARDALDQWRLRLHPFGVFFLEADRLAGALAPRLFAGRSRPRNDRALSKNFKGIHEHAAKAGTVAEQQRDRNNPPRNSRHGQEAANGVATQSRPRLLENLAEHQPPASKRRASIGSTEAARFAGYNADRMEITPSKAIDIAAIFQLVSIPLKKGGIGARLTRPQKP